MILWQPLSSNRRATPARWISLTNETPKLIPNRKLLQCASAISVSTTCAGCYSAPKFQPPRFHRLIGDLYYFAQSARYVSRADAVACPRNLCAWKKHHETV